MPSLVIQMTIANVTRVSHTHEDLASPECLCKQILFGKHKESGFGEDSGHSCEMWSCGIEKTLLERAIKEMQQTMRCEVGRSQV